MCRAMLIQEFDFEKPGTIEKLLTVTNVLCVLQSFLKHVE